MTTGVHEQCLSLAREAIEAIQNGKEGSASLAVRKIELCAQLLDNKPLQRWAKFTLGGYKFNLPIAEDIDQEYVNKVAQKIQELKIPLSDDEIRYRLGESGGGFNSIEFVERSITHLNRGKRSYDGIHHRDNLQRVIVATSNAAYLHATGIFKRLSFGEIPSRQFNTIRDRVDNLLLDLCPEAIEKFMVAYERLASSSAEDWSHALTAARRIFKSVADSLYPPRETPEGARKLGEEQYINRLWAFLDENAEAGSDKDLAKAHINYMGAFLQRLNEKASKGVHAEVSYEEAVRAVLYTYLTLGDLLEFAGKGLKEAVEQSGKVNINDAPLEDLMKIPGVSNELAKEIVKRRVKRKFKSIEELTTFKGVGPKTTEKMREHCVAY